MMELVEVEWIDAGCETQNLSQEEALNLHGLTRRNVGYLLMDTEERVIICFGKIDDLDRHSGVLDTTLVIPRGIVRVVKPLKVAEALDELGE